MPDPKKKLNAEQKKKLNSYIDELAFGSTMIKNYNKKGVNIKSFDKNSITIDNKTLNGINFKNDTIIRLNTLGNPFKKKLLTYPKKI